MEPLTLIRKNDPLWDTQEIATASTEKLFFQNKKGQSGLTIVDTNMSGAGQLPKPQEMEITGLAMIIDPLAADEDVAALLFSGVAEINVNGQNKYRDLLYHLSPGAGILHANVAQVGQPSLTARNYLKDKIKVLPGEQFEVNVIFKSLTLTASVDVKMVIYRDFYVPASSL